MRRTTPPVAGAEGGADCPTGPKRAGSGRLPRRAGGGGGGGEGLRSSVLDSVLVSGAVAKSSPDDDAEELGGAGGGDDRARSVAALVFRLEEYSNEIHEVNLENICSHTQEQTLKRKLEEPGCSNIEEKKRKMGSEPFTEINTRNKIPINLKRKFSSTELGTSTEEAEMDIASAKKN
ncbi:hypothetical protein MSG28_011174 [Choristoneura fumiferana]|uniref:Uncharacterized protein n=1 Tax=Choristoneura fumiferana TaxID=7141 RepID=A0ACC0KRV6_CHOFU|nr:hypothetical protein MSG28_011174 [Choristoneura fumiferana]